MGHLGLMPQSVSALGGYKVARARARCKRKDVDRRQSVLKTGMLQHLLGWCPTAWRDHHANARECADHQLGSGPHAHGQLLIFHICLD